MHMSFMLQGGAGRKATAKVWLAVHQSASTCRVTDADCGDFCVLGMGAMMSWLQTDG